MSIERDHAGETILLKLSRPPVNALDAPMIESLEQAFGEVAAAPPRGGLVFTGAGAVFSAGVDTKAFAEQGLEARRSMVLAITRMVARFVSLPCPVVTAVNGHALGGGFVLMLVGDLRLGADDDAIRLGIPEARAGIPFPAGPSEIIRAELPAPLCRRLALSGAILSPSQLHREGVLDSLCPQGELLARAVEQCATLAAQPGFAVVKKQVRGPLMARLAELARTGDEPHVAAFL